MAFLESSTHAYQSKLYSEFADVYDKVFARIFYPRIAAVIRALNIAPGAKVLEVGCGTGLALDAYPPLMQAGVIPSQAAHPAQARALITFLQSPAGRKILNRYGFQLPQ